MKERLTDVMNDAVRRVEHDGATIICVLCTGEFTGLRSARRIVLPDRILAGVVDALLPEGRLGIVVPHEDQCDSMTRRWSGPARSVALRVVSPYQGVGSFANAVSDLATEGCEMIVLDCMGYSRTMQAQAQAAVETPVLLANAVVGAVLASMVPGLSSVAQDVVGV